MVYVVTHTKQKCTYVKDGAGMYDELLTDARILITCHIEVQCPLRIVEKILF